MRAPKTNPVVKFLKDAGIRPSHFAFFVKEYVKNNRGVKKRTISLLIASQLKEQADLIGYFLKP